MGSCHNLLSCFLVILCHDIVYAVSVSRSHVDDGNSSLCEVNHFCDN